jgi:replicative DNA helicase
VDFYQAYFHVASLPISICEIAVETADVVSMVGELKLREQVDLVIFDYLGLAKDRGDSKRYEQVGAISRGLKNAAKTLNVPMLSLAQLNRECEKRANKKPELADLRDSGDVEQDADIVILLWRVGLHWRDESEWRAAFPKDPYPGERFTELNIAKFRNGKLGYVNLCFDEERMRFCDFEKSGYG